MKKIKLSIVLLTALFLSTGMGETLLAQNSASVSASATVEAAITLTDESTVANTVAFGTVSNGTSPDLNATATGNTDVGPGASMAEYGVSSAATTDIYITLSANSVLLASGGAEPDITFTPAVYGSATTSTAGAGQSEVIAEGDLDSGVAGITTGTADVIESAYEYYLFIGGSLDLTGAVDGTTYSNTGGLTITVVYF